MSSKIKLISAFALFSTALASCSGNANKGLKRVSYKNEVAKCAEIAPTLQAFSEKQRKVVESANEEEETFDYDLFAKGTVTTDIRLKVTGGFKSYVGSSLYYDIPDLNASISDKITIEWNKEEEYIKISDSKSCSYIKTEIGLQGKKVFFKYYESPILGKIKTLFYYGEGEGENGNIVDTYELSFENLVMLEVAYNTGYFGEKKYYTGGYVPTPLSDFYGVAFDLSGFDKNNNMLTPGTWFTNTETVTNLDKFTHEAFSHRYAEKEDKSAASINLKFTNFDLKDLENITPTPTNNGGSTGERKITIESSGRLNCDYFVAYENNFIRQHEIIAKAKDANIFYSKLIPEDDLEAQNTKSAGMSYSLTDVDLDLRISQDVIKDKCVIDSSFKPSDYAYIPF